MRSLILVSCVSPSLVIQNDVLVSHSFNIPTRLRIASDLIRKNSERVSSCICKIVLLSSESRGFLSELHTPTIAPVYLAR